MHKINIQPWFKISHIEMYLDKIAWLIENGKIAIKYNQRVCIFCRIDMNFAIAVHNVWKKIESINWVKHQMLKSVHMVIWLLYKACEFKLLKAVICFWQMHTMTSSLWLEVLSDINISIFLSDSLTKILINQVHIFLVQNMYFVPSDIF